MAVYYDARLKSSRCISDTFFSGKLKLGRLKGRDGWNLSKKIKRGNVSTINFWFAQRLRV